VFVVASARDDINPTEILFEFEGLRRDTPQSRKEGESVAASTDAGFDSEGLQRTVGALCADTHPGAYSGQDAYTGRLIPQIVGSIDCRIGAQRAQNAQAGHMLPIPIHDQATRHAGKNGDKTMGKGNGLGIGQPGDPMNTLTKGDSHAVAIPIGFDSYNLCETGDVTQTLKSPSGGVTESIGAVHIGMAVRRLTPVECERLQGFPDGYTNIPWRKASESPDGPRYKALGNSWAVPVVAWIGQRIQNQLK
jgi:DNA (cytosine-5)-methyltransferase 1